MEDCDVFPNVGKLPECYFMLCSYVDNNNKSQKFKVQIHTWGE